MYKGTIQIPFAKYNRLPLSPTKTCSSSYYSPLCLLANNARIDA